MPAMGESSAGRRAAGLNGLAGVALDVVAVACLGAVPHTYKPHTFAEWLAESRAAPLATALSCWSFTLGLLALAVFAFALPPLVGAARPGLFASGARWLGLGAVLNAAGTLAPLIALDADDGAGRALLASTLFLDATFNACLGLGLVQLGLGAGRAWPAALRGLCVAAGVATLPVALQYTSLDASRLLAVAGPLWLAALTWVSWRLVREPRPASAP
jgi:hypothetical protein